MTLMAVYTNDDDGGSRCIGRCDAKCYAAQEPHYECICGGMNHGGGLAVAVDNTRQYAEVMLEKYAGAKGLQAYHAELGQEVEQFGLFE